MPSDARLVARGPPRRAPQRADRGRVERRAPERVQRAPPAESANARGARRVIASGRAAATRCRSRTAAATRRSRRAPRGRGTRARTEVARARDEHDARARVEPRALERERGVRQRRAHRDRVRGPRTSARPRRAAGCSATARRRRPSSAQSRASGELRARQRRGRVLRRGGALSPRCYHEAYAPHAKIVVVVTVCSFETDRWPAAFAGHAACAAAARAACANYAATRRDGERAR